jgi:multiple sugar transport system substrate-binding protein
LFSCAKKETEKQKLTIWAMGEEGLKLEQIIPLFKKENPNVEIEVQQIPWSAALEKLVTSVASGILPDACQMGTTWMSKFYAMGAFENLDEYIKKSKVVSLENYFKGSLETCSFDGKNYGIPWYVDVRVMYYRKDLYEKLGVPPPRSWDEMISVGKKLLELDKTGKVKSYPYVSYIHWQEFYPFIWQNGGEIIDLSTKKVNLASPEVKEAIEFFVRLRKEKLCPINAAEMDLIYSFRNGYYKTFFSGPWMVEVLKKQAPEIEGKWSVALMPKKKTRTSFVGGSNLVIFKTSKNKELAWKFIEFLSRPEIQVEWYKITSDLPAVRAAWENEIFVNNSMLKIFREQLEDAKSPPNIPEWEQIAEVLHQKVEEIIVGGKDIDLALKEAEEKIRSILK